MTPPPGAADYFCANYASARARFRGSAQAAGAVLHALPLAAKGPAGEDLTIDIAWLGEPDARRILLHSSGLHGVEAYTGSAVQLALLAQQRAVPADCALIFVHVLNPYGMAWLRRANESNVDLNRNFLAENEPWRGAPEIYGRIDPVLNPPTPPGRDFFYVRALWQTWRHGFRPLKQAVARGQYEYSRGLFFGGRKLEQGPRLYLDWLQQHLTRAQYVFALDVHTGLGRWGEDTLLLEAGAGATPPDQLSAALDHPLVDVTADPGVAYEVRGGLGAGLARVFSAVPADFVLQELGTYSPLAVFHALREENRLHHYGVSKPDHPVKRRLMERLCPASPRWRARALSHGVRLAQRAAAWAFCGRHAA
ncbi:MAG: DUF2817 domain-containing protein [Betaproteobacteria bacterium]